MRKHISYLNKRIAMYNDNPEGFKDNKDPEGIFQTSIVLAELKEALKAGKSRNNGRRGQPF